MNTTTEMLTNLWTRAANKRSRADLPGGLIATCDRTKQQIVMEFARPGRPPGLSECLSALGILGLPRDADRCSDRHNGYRIIRYTWPNPAPAQPALLPDTSAPSAPSDPSATSADRTESLDDRFARFDAANPRIYTALEELALHLYYDGHRYFGVKYLSEILRHEIPTGATVGDQFKFNNIFASRYARKLIHNHPELRDAIETRTLRS